MAESQERILKGESVGMDRDSKEKALNSNDREASSSPPRKNNGRNETDKAKRPPSPDLEERHLLTGDRPGNRYVRVVRPFAREFRHHAPGHLVATEHVLEPKGPVGLAVEGIRQVLIGRRLRTEEEMQERTSKIKGLAIFASDNISSSAYATEEVMRVLALASIGALALTVPISLAIIVVLAIVVTSYRQVIRAYPNGGGSYVVAHENLGPIAGLGAAAALLTDYILTVAVSICAGVAAITSAFPELFDQRVAISVAIVFVVMILNLRGIRESGNIFAAPTYVYVFAVLGLIGFGLFRMVTGTMPSYTPPPEWLEAEVAHPLTLLVILRAFSSGSVALSGTEAVSNGVPAFKPPEIRNAQIVLVVMGALFGIIFLGVSTLSGQLGIVPHPHEVETVLSQLARTLVGDGPYYYLIQFSTAIILLLAANTAFNGFPRLASVLAGDNYLPRQFQFRGDRLAFTVGIVGLAGLSVVLIVAFGGSVTSLIPLYTVGVFLAFTLSQAGLVRHWWQLRAEEPAWRWRATLNILGATATGVVTLVVAVSKFMLGAWMVLILMPVLMAMMWAIQRHYRAFEDALTLERWDAPLSQPRSPRVLVPVSRLNRATITALSFARSLTSDVTAVHVSTDLEESKQMKRRWESWGGEVPLVIIESPYRALLSPLLAYIDALDRQEPGRPITVVLSEFVPRYPWEYILHNLTGLRLRIRLFFRRNTVVVDVPYHYGEGMN